MARSRSWLAALVLVGKTASAQPIMVPEHECKVTVALAPDDARAEIEAWVRAEPRCVRELEVRVVPTEDGLYLSATDPHGHVRERVVPDAQAAAVLVVSWMADDSLGGRLPARAAIDPTPPTPVQDVDDPEIPREVMAPGLVRTVMRRDASRGHRWLTIGAIGTTGERGGVRASIDLFSGRTWSLGLAGGAQVGEHDQRSAQARIVVGATHAFGPVALRAHLGFGVDAAPPSDRMQADRMDSARDTDHTRVRPVLEAGLLAKIRISGAWGLVGGPIVSVSPDAPASASLFLGVQHGL